MKQFLLALLLAGLLVGVFTPATHAAPLPDDIIIVSPRTVEDGEEIDGNVVVAGSTLTIEEGGVIDGDLIIYGGSADIYGEVNGEIIVFGGSVNLFEGALVDGDVAIVGGSLEREAGVEITGDIVEPSGFDWGDFYIDPPAAPVAPSAPVWDGPSRVDFGNWDALNTLNRAVRIVFTSLALGALALVAHLFLPRQMQVVGDTMIARPLPSLGLGAITGFGWIVAAGIASIIFVLIAFTILLIPVSVLGFFLLGLGSLLVYLAGLFGWLSLGSLVGRRLVHESRNTLSPAVAAAIGTFTISILVYFLQEVWFVGWIFGLLYLLLLALSLGAVLVSKLGQEPPTETPGLLMTPSAPITPPSDPPPPSEPNLFTSEPPAAAD